MADTTLPRQTDPIRLDLGARSYDILVGSGLCRGAGALIAPHLRQKRVFLVADENVARHHLPTLVASFAAAGIRHDLFTLPSGEASKSFAMLERLTGAVLDTEPERSTMLVAFGGGVVGDLTGFAASILLRGMPFIQIPTTLLSQVDSSVGGKTAINVAQGKNLVGSFHQPRLVIADVDLLGSLAPRDLRAGYGEVVKYGLIDDAPFFTWLETNGPALMAGDAKARIEAVRHSCLAKARIVAADETERDQRALLNLGHTFGHALEAESGFSEVILHGEAVALGSLMAFDLSARLGLAPGPDVDRLRRHLAATGLPTRLPALAGGWLAERLYGHFAHDKKVADGKLTFILARGIGQSFISRDVPSEALMALLADWTEAS